MACKKPGNGSIRSISQVRERKHYIDVRTLRIVVYMPTKSQISNIASTLDMFDATCPLSGQKLPLLTLQHLYGWIYQQMFVGLLQVLIARVWLSREALIQIPGLEDISLIYTNIFTRRCILVHGVTSSRYFLLNSVHDRLDLLCNILVIHCGVLLMEPSFS